MSGPRKTDRVGRFFAWLALGVAILALAGLAIAQTVATPVEAHATLIRSNPRNEEQVPRQPLRVTLQFSEALERDLTSIKVFTGDGKQVDDGTIKFDDKDPAFASIGFASSLSPGLFRVEYANVSKVDGHPWTGSFEFILLNPDGSVPPGATFSGATSGGTDLLPRPIDAALKWIGMTALALVAGAAFFLLVIYRPAAGFLEAESRRSVVDSGERWLITVAHVALPVAFIASAMLVVVTVGRFETSTTLWEYLTSVRSGQYRAVQLIAIVVALIGADLLFLTTTRRLRDLGLLVTIVASFAGLLTYSFVSHSASDAGKFWSITSDFIHIAASSAWLGALALLPAVLGARQGRTSAERFLFEANLFDRFSVLAGLSVAAILSTGTFNALVEIPSWSALKDTTYGRVLIVKLAIIAPLLAVAGLNALFLKPRLVQAIDSQYQQQDEENAEPTPALRRLQSWLPRTIVAEVALVIAVFATVGVLTQTTSATSEVAAKKAQAQAEASFDQSFEQDGLKLELSISPNLVGRNQFELEVKDASDQAVTTITQARLRFQYDGPATIPASELILSSRESGLFTGEGTQFTQRGNWRLEIGLRRSDGDDVSRTVILSVLEPLKVGRPKGDAFDLPFTSFTWNEVMGVGMMLAGVVAVIYRRQLRWLPARAHTGAMAAAVLVMMGGGILAFGVERHTKAANPTAGNPVKPTAESVARGNELFQQNCVVCHGAGGRGDGPNAASLNPAPSDFRLHMPIHTDPEFYRFIADGYPGSAMPAWRDQFSDTDIWNLVNFLRANFTEAPTQ